MAANSAVLAARLRELRRRTGVTLEELGQKTGLAPSTIQRYESGRIRRPREEIIRQIAELLDSSYEELTDTESSDFEDDVVSNAPIADLVCVPVIGSLRGDGVYTSQDILSYEYVPKGLIRKDIKHVFITVDEDAMYPHLHEGDMVLVRYTDKVNTGDYVLISREGGRSMIRKFIRCPNRVEFSPENPYYLPVVVRPGEDTDVRIIGKAIEVRRRIKDK